MQDWNIRLIVGLGNPGAKYEATPHNAGFLVLDHAIDDVFKQNASWKQFNQSKASYLKLNSPDCYLLKPQNYMNNSGQAVAAFAKYYKIQAENILVVHDEVDIPLGTCKLKLSGGSGGHNGLKSIFSHLGSQNFYRLRVGVGKDQNQDTANYVLKQWSNAKLLQFIDPGVEALQMIVDYPISKATQLVNSKKA